MKVLVSVLLSAAIFCETWRVCSSSCVLESDFGLIINCAFKKSTLFRIRNLGGVKAHISWGLSIGDELGFKESISNTEINNKRAATGSKLDAQLALAQQDAQKRKALNVTSPSSDNSTSSFPTPSEILTPPPVPKETDPREPYTSSPWGSTEDYNQQKNSPTTTVSPASATPNGDPDNIIFDYSTKSSKENPTRRAAFPDPVTEVPNSLAGNKNSNETSRSIFPQPRRPSRKSNSSRKKSLNVNNILIAPKEYYPAGYTKKIDENFVTRMRLPKTSFQCKNQIYFPGLYADEDLACMIFHVCVALDNGTIVSKSFLCPESTLFDQSLLRCNWWFYVDCKLSQRRYDTNIPVVRSYEVMRAISSMADRLQHEPSTTAKPKEKD